MNVNQWCVVLGVVLSSGFSGAMAAQEPARSRPNIVFILADDLGYGELGCYGQEKIKTPAIDALAKEGMRFTQHYTGAPVCAPARCSLLTGKHLGHAEIRDNRELRGDREFSGQLPLSGNVVTIAQVLQRAGYATGAFGKWGLGLAETTGSPNKQGFDRFFGVNCQRNAHSYYPRYLDSDSEEVVINEHPIPGYVPQPVGVVNAAKYRAEQYAPDLILKETLQFMEDHKSEPFFLYVPLLEPHVAIQPHQKWIDQYPKEWDQDADGGARVYRGERGYTPHDRPRAAYAAMISHMDDHVAKILEKLEALGLEKNTIVVFTSDNGTTHDAGGVDSGFFRLTAGLRGRKGSCYEGGLRIPCIVKWPGVVQPGSETHAVTYFPDWFPSLARMAQVQCDVEQLDGVDISPVLQGGELAPRAQVMLWEFGGYGGIVAVRDGKWKALRRGMVSKAPQEWELYDLEADPKEAHNLAKQHPEVVERLEKAWKANRTRSVQFPQPLADQ